MSSGPPRKRARMDAPTAPEAEHDTAERACDACRTRRVRCDKVTPCSNCRKRGEVCETTIGVNPEPRTRVIITKEYEKKFDWMVERLANIESLLQRQQYGPSPTQSTASSTRHVTDFGAATAATTIALPSPESQLSVSTDQTTYDATTGAHSNTAQKVVEEALAASPNTYQDHDLLAALNSLKDMVGKIEDGPNSLDYSESAWRPLHSGCGPLTPPSQDEMERLIDQAEGSVALGFTPGLTNAALREKFESVFGKHSNPSAIRRVYVYGVLRLLCEEFSGQLGDKTFAIRCESMGAWFSIQVGHAITDLKLIIPATAEAASALTIASSAAMELCKPVVAQSLSAKAASIVLSLGYNRLSTMRSDTEEARQVKIFIFWMAYWLDSSFSVRLGRAPIIQPHDIEVPRLSEDSVIPKGWAVAFNYSTRISGIQCQIVASLYTPLAAQQTPEERQRRAHELLRELDEAWETRGPGPTAVPLWKDSDAVAHYSTVCLVRHATMHARASESPALESARKALRLNIEAWERHKHLPDFIWSGHCHWTLLKGPITPFIVTFCHIIAHPLTTNEDLQLLEEYVQTLNNLRRFSDGMIKLHRLCDMFCKVATLYVRGKTTEANTQPTISNGEASNGLSASTDWIAQPTLNDIDEYLSTMGFRPPTANDFSGGTGGFEDPMGFDSNYLMDWYQGSNSLMGFLEQDTEVFGDPSFGFPSGPTV